MSVTEPSESAKVGMAKQTEGRALALLCKCASLSSLDGQVTDEPRNRYDRTGNEELISLFPRSATYYRWLPKILSSTRHSSTMKRTAASSFLGLKVFSLPRRCKYNKRDTDNSSYSALQQHQGAHYAQHFTLILATT